MKLIINNDDFGLTYGFNEAIKDSCLSGITTSVSLLANGAAYNHAINLLKTKLNRIGVGIHLNLTDGSSQTSYLTDNKGNYDNSFIDLLLKSRNKKFLKAIKKDFEFQITKILKKGIKLDHIDSDKHVHMIPPIFEITCNLAKEFKIPYVRLTRETLRLNYSTKNITRQTLENIPKVLLLNYFSRINSPILKKFKLKNIDAFYGLLHTNEMTLDNILLALKQALKSRAKNAEILLHPAYTNDPRDIHHISKFMEKYSKLKNREIEARALQSPELKEFIKKNNIQLVSFKEL